MRKILPIYCPEIWGAHYTWVQKIWKKISVEIKLQIIPFSGYHMEAAITVVSLVAWLFDNTYNN